MPYVLKKICKNSYCVKKYDFLRKLRQLYKMKSNVRKCYEHEKQNIYKKIQFCPKKYAVISNNTNWNL